MKRLPEVVLNAQKIRQESFDDNAFKAELKKNKKAKKTAFYQISLEDAAIHACEDAGYDDTADLPVYLLIKNSWDLINIWAKEITETQRAIDKKNESKANPHNMNFPIYTPKKNIEKPKKEVPEFPEPKYDPPTFILSIKKSTKNNLCIEHTPTETIIFEKVNPASIEMVLLSLNSLKISWDNKLKPVPRDFLISCLNTLRFAYQFYDVSKNLKKQIKRRNKQ